MRFLFPPGNADPLIDRETLEIPFRSEPPFGTDTLVLVASAHRRPQLELDLRLLNATREPMRLLEALKKHLEASDRLGLATYPRGRGSGRTGSACRRG